MRSGGRGPRAKDGQRGAVAVEMVIALVVLIPLLGGIIGFGLVMSQQIALDNAVREAARAAVVVGSGDVPGTSVDRRSCGGITLTVRDAFNAPGVSTDPDVKSDRPGASEVNCPKNATTTGTPVCNGSASGDALTVIAQYTSRPLSTLTINLSSKAVYQCEFS